MRAFFIAAAAALTIAPTLAQAWTIDSDASAVRYVSMKNGETAETNVFSGVTGGVEDNVATVTVDLTSLDTGIDTRNARMQAHVFAGQASMSATAAVDSAVLETVAVGRTVTVALEIQFPDVADPYFLDGDFLIVRLSEDRVLVTNPAPLNLHADDFGYMDGIAKLQELAGLESIQLAVPLTVELMFTR